MATAAGKQPSPTHCGAPAMRKIALAPRSASRRLNAASLAQRRPRLFDTSGVAFSRAGASTFARGAAPPSPRRASLQPPRARCPSCLRAARARRQLACGARRRCFMVSRVESPRVKWRRACSSTGRPSDGPFDERRSVDGSGQRAPVLHECPLPVGKEERIGEAIPVDVAGDAGKPDVVVVIYRGIGPMHGDVVDA